METSSKTEGSEFKDLKGHQEAGLHITSYLGKVGTGRRHKLGFMLKKNLVIFYNSSANGRYPESSTSYYYQVGNKVFLGDYNSRQRSILPYLAVVY